MVGVDPNLKDTVYDTNFWPCGIMFSRFNFGLGKNFFDKQ
nr:unnamed protein product [Callosobruchus analis]